MVFNRKQSINMVLAVCEPHVTRPEIMRYFSQELKGQEEFIPDDLKRIVRELTTKKQNGKLGANRQEQSER